MQRIVLFLSAMLLSAGSGALADRSHADNPDGWGASFFIAPTVGHYQYEEPSLMKITGPSYGLALGYRYIAKNNLVWFLQGEANVVHGKYDGHLFDRTPYSFEHDRSNIGVLSSSLGYQFAFQGPKGYQGAVITYIGLGYRYLFNDTSDDPHGYKRVSHYVYLPLGIQLLLTKGQMIMQSQLEFDELLQGRQDTSNINFDGNTYSVSNKQKSGYGANAKLLFGRRQGSWTWLVGPYVRYWNIADSDPVDVGLGPMIEPKNNTLEAGVMLRFVF